MSRLFFLKKLFPIVKNKNDCVEIKRVETVKNA